MNLLERRTGILTIFFMNTTTIDRSLRFFFLLLRFVCSVGRTNFSSFTLHFWTTRRYTESERNKSIFLLVLRLLIHYLLFVLIHDEKDNGFKLFVSTVVYGLEFNSIQTINCEIYNFTAATRGVPVFICTPLL